MSTLVQEIGRDDTKATGHDKISASTLKRLCEVLAVTFTRVERRLFHEDCWNNHVYSDDSGSVECPNCCGTGIVKCLFRHLGTTIRDEAVASVERLEDTDFGDAWSRSQVESYVTSVELAA